jgi:hypothetical protein
MNRLEYLLASTLLRLVRLVVMRLPRHPDRIVLATARVSTLDGNLLYLHRAMTAHHPERDYVLLLEPYSYGLAGKLAYRLGSAGSSDNPAGAKTTMPLLLLAGAK